MHFDSDMCLIDKKYLNFCAGTVKISCMIVYTFANLIVSRPSQDRGYPF